MTKRVRTGVKGLDDVLSGGFIEGSAVLLQGAPGTGKTTLGLQYLHTGVVQEDEPGLLVTFEEFPYSLYRDAQTHGWDLRALEEANKLRIIFTSPQILLSSLQSPTSPLNRTIIEWNVRRVVLDSITHFTRMTQDPHELRNVYNSVINAFKREGITSLLLSESSSPRLYSAKGRLAYVVDTIMMMRYVEVDSAMQRALLVLKMRGSQHSKNIYRFSIEQEGIVIRERFLNMHGVLTGMPTHLSSRGR
jgi:circadian clock protein KaiC